MSKLVSQVLFHLVLLAWTQAQQPIIVDQYNLWSITTYHVFSIHGVQYSDIDVYKVITVAEKRMDKENRHCIFRRTGDTLTLRNRSSGCYHDDRRIKMLSPTIPAVQIREPQGYLALPPEGQWHVKNCFKRGEISPKYTVNFKTIANVTYLYCGGSSILFENGTHTICPNHIFTIPANETVFIDGTMMGPFISKPPNQDTIIGLRKEIIVGICIGVPISLIIFITIIVLVCRVCCRTKHQPLFNTSATQTPIHLNNPASNSVETENIELSVRDNSSYSLSKQVSASKDNKPLITPVKMEPTKKEQKKEKVEKEDKAAMKAESKKTNWAEKVGTREPSQRNARRNLQAHFQVASTSSEQPTLPDSFLSEDDASP